MKFLEALSGLVSHIGQFEDHARTLKNQNLADIIGAAKASISQAMTHPDVSKLDEDEPLPPAPLPGTEGNTEAPPAPLPGTVPLPQA